MIHESFPVKHVNEEKNNKLGGGIVVGGFTATITEKNTLKTQVYLLVLWEFKTTPSPHTLTELEHMVDHADWYAKYFDSEIEDDDDLDNADDIENGIINGETDETIIHVQGVDSETFENDDVIN